MTVAQIPQVIVSESILPRRYQEEIFRRAQNSNVIAALDTGSGKTFISILLIKWIVLQEKAKRKVIVFLVPKVALVKQQADSIAAHTPLRVKMFHGSLDLDLTDRANWKKSFEQSDLTVAAAQIFLNILTHSHWSVEKVSLLIFDECHHTRKNHAYNGIMHEYFQTIPSDRPKVFGMTASPIWNPKDAEGSLATLEKNLDATVIAVREHVEELQENSPRPVEVIKEFSPPSDTYDYLYPTLWDCLSLFTNAVEINIPVDKLHMKYQMTRNSLGAFSADLFLYTDIKTRLIHFIDELESSQNETFLGLDGFDHHIDVDESSESAQSQFPAISPDLEQIDAILSEFRPFFDSGTEVPAVPIPVPLAWCTPKVNALVEVLLEHYSPTFHAIVFVEQRQVAACLAKILPCIPELRGYVRCAELVGHGANHGHGPVVNSNARGMGLARQQDTVELFRQGKLNLLVATSVAEEGLHFPACDIVVRFDPIQHMVGYVQSRGRARTKTSTFVIMAQKDHSAHLVRYNAFLKSEPELKRVYQTREEPAATRLDPGEDSEEGEVEEDDPADVAVRERYIVPSTGAVLTYDSAVNLLNHLCSLIPHDAYTPPQLPKYSGDYAVMLELPSSLPLPIDRLFFSGPERRSKREAKRAVAFLAVKELHRLDVFDDYLLPATSSKGRGTEDADGRGILDFSDVPDLMDVLVRDPWTLGAKLYLHIVTIDDQDVGGLVTGTCLPPVEFKSDGSTIQLRYDRVLLFDEDEEWDQRRMLSEFMRMGLWFCVTGRPAELPFSSFLVPLLPNKHIDFEVVERVASEPYGSYDWSGASEKDYNHLMVMNSNQYGRALVLRNIRYDLTPLSTTPPGSKESEYPTYRDYFVQRWTRKKREAFVPENSFLIEATYLPRCPSSVYRVREHLIDLDLCKRQIARAGLLVPKDACRRVHFSEDVYRAFLLLPKLCRRVTDVYRARQERIELGLPMIAEDLLIEASTLPTTSLTFNNQRLETLGDSVLKLGSTVHIMNKYPHRHEGQLSHLRQNSVSNRTLLSRAKEIELERFLNSESHNLHFWRYTVPEDTDSTLCRIRRSTRREFPRRSLQDCMEATLGAAFVTGGIDMALQAGTALGLSFGGPIPWSLKYSRRPESSPAPHLFADLQESLCYEFHRGDLLVEAATHPSFATSASSSYQRLEFLGDAVIDLVVLNYLYRRFPQANSGQLSAARSRAVCGPTLASISVRRLCLHKILLVNNVELSSAINRHVPILESTSVEDIINKGWKYDPPKALSDVLESVVGAIFVDSAYNFEKVASVVELIMSDVLELLSPNLPKDPVSELMVWAASSGCRRISFRKTQSHAELRRNDSVSVVVHDVVVAGPITASNLSLSKGLAAERARILLDDHSSDQCLTSLCDCSMAMKPQVPQVSLAIPDENDISKPVSDENEEGFATIAQRKLDETRTVNPEECEGEVDAEIVVHEGPE
ncbi:hypothetical protein SERLADRAFT_441040 [Serpula lacrymans var. lacrymans S7.9]|uniref:Dicer-like protein 1 n=1 Tax=Serpula lacrymans var. lacrymans (strain S7.9) TaxID=578457 RepID=F8P5C2_SERL9|nr:uncharacterized protein SERLADRAFT_441040 [Serpula lacrymans var. lacrymans S7.9]EGO21809.1 hypothetical protein SERLADRAFT_441040 [Serpula lacrymans var. lacrymans S7.9]